MRIAAVAESEGGGRLRELGEQASGRDGALWRVGDLAGAVADHEALGRRSGEPVRWVFADTSQIYPALLSRGVRLSRCHDSTLVEALLMGYAGRFGEAHTLGAAWARLHGREAPPDPVPQSAEGRAPQPTLFEPDRSTLPSGADALDALVEVYADQRRRMAELDHPGRFALLAAVESAGALGAAEMAHDGVPWRADVHDAVLTEQLGPRPTAGARPPVLADLAARISEAFGRTVNPDSPVQLMRAFEAVGHPVPSTRSWVLQRVDHPAVPLLLRYKELARLHSAHGWSWLDTWVSGGRFRTDYIVGGVVSGRWATRGGGALQVPKVVRRAVVADPGWTLVCADAGQLEPRILAAVSGDSALAAAAGSDDLYARLAGSFGGDRQRAKIALLAAMYGQTSGDAAALLPRLRQAYPRAVDHVDAAAREGEQGHLVRSWLGRTCPPPMWGGDDPDEGAPAGPSDRAARERGRFTRNFVVQATAAEWALVLMAAVRRGLTDLDTAAGRPQLVFFQHDELVLHVPRTLAEAAVQTLRAAADEAAALMFGDTPVRFPLDIAVVDRYSDA
ncbi:bifunctional 3'-5' exonuclease/DNA polymerase [Streptomonospora wellingtoniae]|uniref:DNA-directed DNA polymerase n=1 Tax=Streptomonospora wellingtoniae TaxID=3075544 RepID=A0ABU2KYB3_9ACTN|nr:bifunctional 3'-5' exonuclease/DNA polymerase [Streptomonospora sp. DSM 45055]MDT0304132.1 bifunctional 3'-5' exonuclease/DNA polymerase [Streptomonospora sp. DSM 45055]